MRKPTLLLTVLLGLQAQVVADKVAGNLKDLITLDVCPIGIQVYFDGVRNPTEEEILLRLVKEQDLLFGTKFMDSPYITCSQGTIISFDTSKNSTGAYVYTYSFSVYSSDAQIKKFSDQSPVKYATYYDIGGFGYASSLTSLQRTMTEATKTLFQSFVPDWRKTH